MYSYSVKHETLCSLDPCCVPRIQLITAAIINFGPVQTTSVKFQNTASFLRQLGSSPTLICHEKAAFEKRSSITSNCRKKKTPALCFSGHRKRLENDNHDISLAEFSSNTLNSKIAGVSVLRFQIPPA